MTENETKFEELKDAVCELVSISEENSRSVDFERLDNLGVQIIDSIEELQQYRAIGTVEDFKALKEKNTPKKIAYQEEHEKCPTCGSFNVFGNYCTECGQKIDFEKENKQ